MYIDRDKYTSHINNPDKVIVMRRIIDKIEIVINNHTIESTDFLDPYERRLAKSILNRFMEIKYIEFGGYDDAERKSIVIFPEYTYEPEVDSPVGILKISGDLGNLSHPDYLGAILNLGITRDKIGDILVTEEYGFVVVKDEISNFIEYNLMKIADKNVKLEKISEEDLIIPELEYKIKKEFLSSLRLDVVISGAYNLSRKDSMSLINSDRVKVNWETINKTYHEIEEGDVISTRGYGRIILSEIKGTSKKGRYISNIKILL